MSTSMSLIILNFQCLLQCQLSIQFKSKLIHSQFAFGPTIMVMYVFKSNQCQSTLNLYLVKSILQCILLYVLLLVKWLVRSKEQLAPAYMPMFPVKRQVRSEEQFVPCLCFVIGQTTSSIQRTVCTNLHVVILIKPQVRSKEQLVSTFCLCPQVKWQVRSKEQFVPAYLFVFSIK
jgi:hypothetical protein